MQSLFPGTILLSSEEGETDGWCVCVCVYVCVCECVHGEYTEEGEVSRISCQLLFGASLTNHVNVNVISSL